MIISVTSLKGGVGKSTIAQNLAVCFAHNNYKVCLVDTDENQSSLQWSGLRSEDYPEVPVFGLPDGKTLTKNIQPLHRDYEVVIIDGTPSLSQLTSKIILLGDIVLTPMLPGGLDVWATEKFISRYDDAQTLKGEEIPAFFILNQYDNNQILDREVKDILTDWAIKPLKNTLKSRVAYREAVIQGLGVYEYKDKKAKSEILNVFNELKEIIKNLN